MSALPKYEPHRYSEWNSQIISRVWVTPLIAKEWLATMGVNRRVLTSVLLRYKAAMQNGEWIDENPEPIIFDDHGKLIDGQHRLLALSELRDHKGYSFLVVKGVKPQAMLVMNSGRMRSDSEAIYISGVKDYDLKNEARTTAFMLGWDVKQKAGKHQRSKETKIREWFKYREVINWVSNRLPFNFARISTLVAVFARAKHGLVDPNRLEEFMSVFSSKEDIPSIHMEPANLLRSWIVTGKINTHGWKQRQEYYGVSQYALKRFLDGGRLYRIPAAVHINAQGDLWPLKD